ncbi:MAG: peptidase S8 [Sphingobacteriaceae bacterium]|nr:MAG: peptidase S8 [Sphingobacteriaceae bacterium]
MPPLPTLPPTGNPTAAPTVRPSYLPVLPTPTPSAVPTITPTASPTINDPFKTTQYNSLSKIKLLESLAMYQGNANVTIAIIDTGVEATHEDLSNKIVSGFTDFSGSSEKLDPHGHGTHCAGVAAAATNNGIGIVGMAPNAKIMPIQVLNAAGAGSNASVAAGIMFAADSSAKVLSMSLGGPDDSAAIRTAVNHAISQGKVMVAAMGNSALTGNPTSYPANYSGVIAVGATDATDIRANFSQYGNHIAVSAPGVNIYSTFKGNSYSYMSGTSMACPAVAGLAALMLANKPTLTPSEIRTKIQNGTDDLGSTGFDVYFGSGRINVLKTLSNL